MKSIVKVTNDAQIGKKTKHHAFKNDELNAHKKTLSPRKDPMSLAASILFVSCKEQRRIRLKCIWLKQWV
jgi:hypothetical protein